MTEPGFYKLCLIGWLVLAPATAALLRLVSAPYGRHARAGWGPLLPARAAWLLMEAPAALVPLLCLALGARREAGAVALFGLWELHYLHRAFIFPFRLRGGRAMPLAVALLGLLFNVVNGYLIGRWLFGLGAPRPAAWLLDGRFLAGTALFWGGLAVNLHADTVLLRLRARGGGYQVPHGGLFRWVSCPNYLGEIVEWIGWALASWSLPGLGFALWTAANLGPRAGAHHRFYRERFPGYPAERRALLPLLW